VRAGISFIVVLIGFGGSDCGPCDKSSVLMNGKEFLEKQSDCKFRSMVCDITQTYWIMLIFRGDSLLTLTLL
jgi:hypothetical protein